MAGHVYWSHHENTSTNTTHLLWIGRWIEVRWVVDAWRFKSGRDAADWLLWPEDEKGV